MEKTNLILAVITSIVTIITTVLVLVCGVISKVDGYELFLLLSPMIIGTIIGAWLIIGRYQEE